MWGLRRRCAPRRRRTSRPSLSVSFEHSVECLPSGASVAEGGALDAAHDGIRLIAVWWPNPGYRIAPSDAVSGPRSAICWRCFQRLRMEEAKQLLEVTDLVRTGSAVRPPPSSGGCSSGTPASPRRVIGSGSRRSGSRQAEVFDLTPAEWGICFGRQMYVFCRTRLPPFFI